MSEVVADQNANEKMTLSKTVGVLSAVFSLASAIVLSYGLRDLVDSRTTRAFFLLSIFVLSRAFMYVTLDEYAAHAERSYRKRWRTVSSYRLATSTPGEIHSLDTAIDNLCAEPALAVVQYCAATSLLALAPIFYFGGWLCVLIVVVLMGLSIPAYISAGRATVRSLEDFHQRRSSLVARQLRLLRSMTDLRALGAVDFGADEIAAASDAENRSVLGGVRVAIRSTLVTEFMSGVSVGLVAMVVGIRLWHHSIGLGPALGAVLMTAEMYTALRRYGSEFHRRDDAKTARLLLSAGNEIHTNTGTWLLEVDAVSTAAPALPVSFQLGDGGRIRLQGPSGVGKSSLIDTSLGLREPVSGSVRCSAKRIGLIRSDNHFVVGSLRENLSLGDRIDDVRIRDVVRSVGLTDLRFADLDALILEDARDFSTGERIQLALARAILASTQLLVLDDIASSLDETTRSTLSSLLSEFDGAVIEAGHDQYMLDRVDRVIEVAAR